LASLVFDEDVGDSFSFTHDGTNAFFQIDASGQLSTRAVLDSTIDYETLGSANTPYFPNTGCTGCTNAATQNYCACGFNLSGESNNCCGADAFAIGASCSDYVSELCGDCAACYPDPRGRDVVITFQVTVRDDDLDSATATISVTVTDVNETPTFSNQVITINEDASNNLELVENLQAFAGTGDILAYPGQSLAFFLSGSTPADALGMFYLVSGIDATALYFLSGELDYEGGTTSFVLDLNLNDNGFPAAEYNEGQVTVNVLNVNEAPVWGDSLIWVVDENSSSGTVAANKDGLADDSLARVVTDPDLGQDENNCCNVITFEVNADSTQTAFVLDGDSIAVAEALNYEGGVNIYTIKIDAKNSDGLFTTAEVRVEVNDVEEPPTITNGGDTFYLSQDDPVEASLGVVIATDEDTLQQSTLVYSISECAGKALNADAASNGEDGTKCWFQIDDNGGENEACDTDEGVCGGRIRMNYAGSSELKQEDAYAVAVTVTDGITPVTATFNFIVTEVNYPPVYAGDTSGEIAEDAAGGNSIIDLVATDLDPNDAVAFNLYSVAYTVGDDVDAIPVVILYDAENDSLFPFSIFTSEACTAPCREADLQLNAAITLDFEEITSYTVTLQMVDSSTEGRTKFQVVTVTVTNVNETPLFTTFFDPPQLEVPESATDGYVLGTIGGVDPDSCSSCSSDEDATTTCCIVYSLSGSGLFEIDSATGEVTVSGTSAFDYESFGDGEDKFYTVLVTVSDGELSVEQSFQVFITNVNEAPSPESATVTVSEATAPGTLLGVVPVTDPDISDSNLVDGYYTFEILNDSDGLFTINGAGEVFLADEKSLDFETLDVHALQVRVTDMVLTQDPYFMPTTIDGTFQATNSLTPTFTINVVDSPDVVVTSITGNTVFGTAGGDTITLVGSNFGTLRSSPDLSVTYTNSEYTYSAVGCAVQNFGVTNTEIVCTTVPGHGGDGYLWTVTVAGTSAGTGTSSATTSFSAPTITAVSGPLSSTRGDATITLTGTNFGLAAGASTTHVSAYYGKTVPPCSLVEGSSCIPVANQITAGGCIVSEDHTEVQCQTGDGVSSGLVWVVDVEGAESADSTDTTAYLPPSVQSLTLVSTALSTDDGDVSFSVTGGDTVRLVGENFGNRFTDENQLAAFYGPDSDPYLYTATGCAVTSDHGEMDCQTVAAIPSGIGFNHKWTIRVAGQDSTPSTFETDYTTEIQQLCIDHPACEATPTGLSDGTNADGSRVVISLVGVNFGSSSAARTVFFGKVDVDGNLVDCCPEETSVDVSTAACAAVDSSHTCDAELLQFFLPEGFGINVPVSVDIVEPDGSRRLVAVAQDDGLVTFTSKSARHHIATLELGERRAAESNSVGFEYIGPIVKTNFAIPEGGKYFPEIYDRFGTLRAVYPRSGCFGDEFSRDSEPPYELYCTNPVLMKIGGSSLGTSAGAIKFRDPITDEVMGECLPACVCGPEDISGGAADCGWPFGCKQTHDEIVCQVLEGRGVNNLVVVTVGGAPSVFESESLYFSYDGPIVERVYLGTIEVADEFDVTLTSCDSTPSPTANGDAAGVPDSCVNGFEATIAYDETFVDPATPAPTADGFEERAISTRYQQYLRNYGDSAYALSYNALGFESSFQLLEIYGQNFGRDSSDVFVTLNGKACEEATWMDGEEYLGGDRFPSYITCKAPFDVAGPKTAIVSVGGQNWTQVVGTTVDELNQEWYEGSRQGVREIPQPDQDYQPAVYMFNSICKNDTLLFDERGTPSLDIYYARPNEECVQCPEGANCFALGYTDPSSEFGFWKTYFPVESEEARNDLIGCPAERLDRTEGTCPVFQACQPFESCIGNNNCEVGYEWQKATCEEFYSNNEDRQTCTTDLECRCGRNADGTVNLDDCLDTFSECSEGDPERCSVCVEGTCSCKSASRCSLCTSGEFFRLDGKCEPCPTNVVFLIVLFFMALVAVAIGGYVLNKKQFNLAFISIGVDYFQVLAIFASADIEWPQQLLDLFRLFSVFNFNIDITAPECVVPDLPFSLKWFGTMFLPVGCLVVLLCVHLYHIIRKTFIDKKTKDKLNKHVHVLVAAMFTAMYYLYLTLTRKALDIFNCNPVLPDDGYTYTQFSSIECDGGLCRCWEEGSLQLDLVPWAVIFFCSYSLGYPILVYTILRKNKDLLKEDQLLRAKGLGDDRKSNPHAYEVRKRYHKLYYHFKPGKTYWITYIICRKFGIAVSALLFRDNPSFQLSMVLLVLFGSYILQVQNRPYMSSADREEVLKHHQAKIDSGSRKDVQAHLELQERLNQIDKDIAHEKRLKGGIGKFDDIDDSYALSKRTKKFFFDFNTVEQTLLACAILVCLAGIMFESPRFIERDDLDWQKDTLTYLIIIVIVYSIVYYMAIFVSEFLTALGYSDIAKFCKVFMTRKYRERENSMDAEMKEAEAHMNSQANPMMYAEDLKQAEYKAQQTGQQADDLREELNKLKALNETLVTEVNDAKKREASANLSHYAGSPGSNKKKGGSKKKKKFGKTSEEGTKTTLSLNAFSMTDNGWSLIFFF
jgi:hypothetical protein